MSGQQRIGGGMERSSMDRGSAERGESRIPQDQVDQANADIVSVIGKYVALKKGGKDWVGLCPFHNEKSPSFSVSEAKQFYYCYGCGASGDAVGFVRDHLGVSFREAVESINGRITLEGGAAIQPPRPRAIKCTLPGHAEDAEKAARAVERSRLVPQHSYLLSNNTAPCGDVLELKGHLIVPLLNNIGEQVNAAAITLTGIKYAAGSPSFGAAAILEPAAEHDGKAIICVDYAHAWRIWWAQGGRSRVLCAMEAENFDWMLRNCRSMFSHVGCDIAEADWFYEYGHDVVAVPSASYSQVDCATACA